MAGKLRTCRVISQLVGKQVVRAILMNRGRVFLSTTAMRRSGYDSHGGEYQPLPIKADIGKREVVGFGMNGEESYIDHYGFPFPAIRFKEDSAEVGKLREKEKGDWKKMTVSEKKELYRSSFCQTLVEVKAPTGEWKAILGLLLTCVSVALWGFVWLTTYGKYSVRKFFCVIKLDNLMRGRGKFPSSRKFPIRLYTKVDNVCTECN